MFPRISSFNIPSLLAMAALFAMFSGCEYKTNELEGLQIYNVLDPQSEVDIFTVDSIRIKNNEVHFYFQTDISEIKDTSRIKRVVVYKDGEESKWLTPGNYTYFVDINVKVGETYTYEFALEDTDKEHSKLSQPYVVTVQ